MLGMPHYRQKKFMDPIQRLNPSLRKYEMVSTVKVIFYAGKCYQCSKVKPQQWETTKDGVGNA